ncbi:MAG: S8 family serine peptidase [Bdellovibrionota bacterium]
MKTVQKKYNLGALGCLLLLASCGDMKTIVEAPKVTLDPPLKELEVADDAAADAAAPAANPGGDPLAEKQWALKQVGAPEAWAVGGVGVRRMRVAILSSGVDYNHEDLQGNIAINDAENTGSDQLKPQPIDKKDSDGNGYVDDLVGWDTVDNDGFPYDIQGDGTAAAGVIGAIHNNGLGIKGILGEVSIVPVRYIDSTGATSVDKLIEALRYVNSLKKKVDVVLIQVANVDFTQSEGVDTGGFFPEGMGSGLSQKSTLDAELKKLEAEDIPVIVNSGNRRTDIERSKGVINSLVTKSNVFAVTSVDDQDVKPEAANFSPRTVITAAPGVGILTTAPGSKYAEAKGTFIAAAHVAAAITLAKAHSNRATTKDLRSLLLTKGDIVQGLSAQVLGSNRLNVGKLVSGIMQPAGQ